MSARGELVFMVALLSSVFAASFKESGENLSEQAECRGVCSLTRDKTSKSGVKVLRALSCYHCLNRRKGKTLRQERIRDRLIATTFTKRHRRSLFLDPSLPTSSTALNPLDCVGGIDDNSVPENVEPSKVEVAFGKYENTSYWYVNVSWTPLNDSSGQLYGTLVDILVTPMKLEGVCTVLGVNQTFLNINISFYGYSYPEPIHLSIRGLPYQKNAVGNGKAMASYGPTFDSGGSSSKSPATTTFSGTASDSGGSSSKSPATTTFSGTASDSGGSSSKSPATTTFSGTASDSGGSSSKSPATTTVGTGVPTPMNKESMDQSMHEVFTLLANKGVIITIPNGKETYTMYCDCHGPVNKKNEAASPRASHPRRSANYTITYVSIATASGILVGLFLVLGVLKCMFVYIRRPKGRRLSVPSGFDYHAFIIYSSKDSEWVQNKLRIPLEEKYLLQCCIHYRDFAPGGIFVNSMADSVEKSFKIIAVYSKNFLESPFCRHELELAKYRQISQGDDCLVIIRIDDAEFNKLPKGLQERSVIDYVNPMERLCWMDRLRQFLQVPEDSDNQDAVTGQERDNNNRRDSRVGKTTRKNVFVRLSSTSSNESAESFV